MLLGVRLLRQNTLEKTVHHVTSDSLFTALLSSAHILEGCRDFCTCSENRKPVRKVGDSSPTPLDPPLARAFLLLQRH